jgi:hypothetical protein
VWTIHSQPPARSRQDKLRPLSNHRTTNKEFAPRHRNDWAKAIGALRWIPSYGWQRLTRRSTPPTLHVIIAIADHFEPYISPGNPRQFLSHAEQARRVKQWCQQYPLVFDHYRDRSGSPLKHSYFYAAEHYDDEIIETLAAHCRQGWGEIEIHLHHGIDSPDTADNTKDTLITFRDRLRAHGCLCHLDTSGSPRYGFVHGNWALANSAGGRFCGVDEEIQILAETGCYADFTLPSAPSIAQISKINALYECEGPLDHRSAHRHGCDLASGRAPHKFPLMIQGPLGFSFHRRKHGVLPVIENSALSSANPPSPHRLKLWTNARITVQGRPEWVFVKLHCHGMNPIDTPTLLGHPMKDLLQHLATLEHRGDSCFHFVTAREMTNIILAACDGKQGEPSDFRDYRLRLFK